MTNRDQSSGDSRSESAHAPPTVLVCLARAALRRPVGAETYGPSMVGRGETHGPCIDQQRLDSEGCNSTYRRHWTCSQAQAHPPCTHISSRNLAPFLCVPPSPFTPHPPLPSGLLASRTDPSLPRPISRPCQAPVDRCITNPKL